MKPLALMKNVLAVFAPLSLVLTGCTVPQAEEDFTPQLDESYTAEASLAYGDGQTALVQITRYTDGLWEAAFTEPPTLAGVVLSFDGNACSASYKGLAFTVPKTALPAKNMLAALTESLDAAAAAESLACTQQEDGTWSTDGQCAAGSYTLIFSDAGTPAVFEVPSQPLTVTFSGYTVCEEPAAGTDTSTETTAVSETAVISETQTEGTS